MKIAPTDDLLLKVPYTDPAASIRIARHLSGYFEQLEPGRRIAVVCLGTDRSTGDSLGPLVGSALSKLHSSAFDLYGTLAEPVHALNIDATLEKLQLGGGNPFIVGIDACLGQVNSVGCIQVGAGPIHPGAGVNKQLSPVGDIHISGVVNVGGFMEYSVLQSTRLHVVIRMADLIARSLFSAVTLPAGIYKHSGSHHNLMETQNA